MQIHEKDQQIKRNCMSNSIPDLLANSKNRFWFSAREIADVFEIPEQTVENYIATLLNEGERKEDTDVKIIPELDGEGKITNVSYYSLDALISIGLRVGGKNGKWFRRWTFQNLGEYVVKGFILDDERLKNPDGDDDSFDEL